MKKLRNTTLWPKSNINIIVKKSIPLTSRQILKYLFRNIKGELSLALTMEYHLRKRIQKRFFFKNDLELKFLSKSCYYNPKINPNMRSFRLSLHTNKGEKAKEKLTRNYKKQKVEFITGKA